jgi:hypothetical protein
MLWRLAQAYIDYSRFVDLSNEFRDFLKTRNPATQRTAQPQSLADGSFHRARDCRLGARLIPARRDERTNAKEWGRN